jgi:hypothetical protein
MFFWSISTQLLRRANNGTVLESFDTQNQVLWKMKFCTDVLWMINWGYIVQFCRRNVENIALHVPLESEDRAQLCF